MKRIWMYLAMTLVIAVASIPVGMAQDQKQDPAVEVISLKRIWSDPEGTFTNVRGPKFINGKIFACTVGEYIKVSSDTGKTWTQIGPNSGLDLDLGMSAFVTEIDSGYMLTGGADWIYRSTNVGKTWTKIRYIRNDIKVACSIFRTKGDTLFAGGWGMLRSVDNGNTWTQILGGDSLRSWLGAFVQMPSGKIVAGLDNNSVPGYGGGILISSDGGLNWTFSNSGLPNHKDIESLAAASTGSSKKVYAAIYDQGLYVSENEGLSWNQAPGISGVYAHTVGVFPVLGTYVGFSPTTNQPEQLFKEAPGAVSWTPVGFAGKPLSVLGLGILDANHLLVGTSDGLWLATFQVLATPVEKDNGVVTSFTLSQNYPNPFNPSTTIKFSLPTRTNVDLKIYNALGQMVETIVSGGLNAGTHSYVWNAENYPSGVYFYQLRAGTFTETKRMLLMK